MLQQPDQLGSLACGDRRDPRFHGGDGLRIGHGRVGYPPFDSARRGEAAQTVCQIEALAVINHWLTITW